LTFVTLLCKISNNHYIKLISKQTIEETLKRFWHLHTEKKRHCICDETFRGERSRLPLFETNHQRASSSKMHSNLMESFLFYYGKSVFVFGNDKMGFYCRNVDSLYLYYKRHTIMSLVFLSNCLKITQQFKTPQFPVRKTLAKSKEKLNLHLSSKVAFITFISTHLHVLLVILPSIRLHIRQKSNQKETFYVDLSEQFSHMFLLKLFFE
jgi:hypothetical protein